MHRIILALVAGIVCFAPLSTARSQTVWSGYDFSFEKPDNAPYTLPENQDRITDNVWITRDINSGIFNASEETAYTTGSPADTEWATDLNNIGGEMIEATNWADLTFAPWIDAYGGQGSGQLPSRLINRNAVVHLITDDIYLDLRFTSFTPQGPGGFAYDRALPPAGPETTGDYNLDGFVNAADYVRWRKTFGDEVSPGSGADGVPDGTIDDADYDFWVDHFGETAPLGSGPTALAVPEPAALAVSAFALLLATNFRCRRSFGKTRAHQ